VHARCRLAERDVAALDSLPAEHGTAAAFPVVLHRAVLDRVAGGTLAVPQCRTARELDLVERLFASSPPLGAAEGWGARFSRELNATDDRPSMREGRAGLPVLEGRHISPFVADAARAARSVPREIAARLLPERPFTRRRLAFRDVASASNRVTVIAARLPADTVSTHTLLCLRDACEDAVQLFLCAVLNSYVFNFLARLWVQTHVTAALVERLPAPRIAQNDTRFLRIVADVGAIERSGRLEEGADTGLQAAVAALYGLGRDDFSAVLDTFPLVPSGSRQAALSALERER
jgi:hypothetical protein